ncbi:hypothetical protein ALP73_01110 [Pseudomonas coronafaciens pv. garcae]|uniref:hypothetical protein n=1 Tax=Pseudomonas syringae group TaxID=136849 RepID=UPI000F3EA5E3|nr:hypothetical protein [Pseudomonas coronafaciens]RMS09325.1 hypothetical protein ALP73_01110 [Pseudomonas coronafaciens pv. garcae]
MIVEAITLGGLIMSGLVFMCSCLDGLAKEARRANDLKEAELRASGISILPSGSASS